MASHASNTVRDTSHHGPVLRAIGWISTACGIASALMILISVLITCQMIFVRKVLNDSTIWQTEAVTYMMIAATLLGLPYVQRLRGHVNVDLLPLLLPVGARKAVQGLTLLATIAITVVMMFYGYELFHIAFERNWKSDTVWGASLWVPYLALPVGFGVFLLQLISDLVDLIRGRY